MTLKFNYAKTLILLISVMILSGCNTQKPEYKPKEGEPNLSLLTGSWKGVVQGDSGYTSEVWYEGELEMIGNQAGEIDIFYFNPLDSEGQPKEDGWVDKIYISNGEITYLTNDYPMSKWQQTDSLDFKWMLLGEKFYDDQEGDYRNFAVFERKEDSLSIKTGRMIGEGSTFQVNYEYNYQQTSK